MLLSVLLSMLEAVCTCCVGVTIALESMGAPATDTCSTAFVCCVMPRICCRAELQAAKAAAKAEKATQQPPRLGKVKFEAEPVQVCLMLQLRLVC